MKNGLIDVETASHADKALTAEQMLYRRVIYQAYLDARSPEHPNLGGKPRGADTPRSQSDRREARAWFIRAGLDFETVCSAAALIPGNVRRAVCELLSFGERLPA
jgi:hypothetical protein